MELGAGVRLALAALIVLALPLAQCTNDRKCGLHLTTPGYTYPQGDIVIREGTPLEILCVLSNTTYEDHSYNSSDLRVYNNLTLVDPEYLSIVNETTLRYYVAKTPPMKSMFYCKLKMRTNAKETTVCLNTVSVGYEPLGVENFTCISYNWQRLNCTWVPKYNPVPTTYRIFFQVRSHELSAYKCPNNSDERANTCVWDDASDPPYRQSHPMYKLTLAGENALNNKSFSFEMDHFKHILPAAPTNLEVVNATSSSFFLKWIVPFPMNSWARSYRLVYKIAYAYKGAKELHDKADPFITAFEGYAEDDYEGTPHCHSSFDQSQDFVCYFNLTGLQYAYYLYDIRVFIKTENASDAFWSLPVFQVKKTAPSIPPKPPSTDVGSFEVAYYNDKRDVTVYWQSLPENLYSGDNFSYKIVEVLQNNKSTTSLRMDPVGKKSVVLRNLTQQDSYVVRIASSNEVGDSLETSVVTIPCFRKCLPSYKHTLSEPESFTKTTLRSGDFKLSWRSPQNSSHEVTSYTIFWCDSLGDRPETCSGFLNWTHVGKDARELIVKLKPMMYHFAISANSEMGSSGMVWASCSMIADKVDKLKTVWVPKFDATSMDVEWKLHCTDANNVVKGFVIFYCVAFSGTNQECKEREQNMTIYGDHSLKTASLSGLQPYVTYRISVAIRTEVGWSLPSDPIFKTLNEAAPSTPPTDVRVTAVTNDTIKLSWNAPTKPNGILKFYEINYNGNISKHKHNSSKSTDVTKPTEQRQDVTIENLLSYTNYSIQIKACTVACSDASPSVAAQTRIGVPGAVLRPSVKYLNSTQVLLTWQPPQIRGGRIDYYSVSMNVVSTDLVTQNKTLEYNVTGTQKQVTIDDCKTVSNLLITFTIRAVNVDGDKVFLGEAVTVPTITCFTGERLLYIVLCSVGGAGISLVVVGVAIYYSRMLHKSCREMRDLTVKIPTGMVPEDEAKDADFVTKTTWIPHDPDNDDSSSNTRPAADKERLLQRKDDRHGESSGCSSGHDTVSSSTTSGTHISTDSGTEMDQNEQGFSGSGKWAAGNNTAVENKNKLEAEWEPSPYVHVGSPTSMTATSEASKPLYPNVEPPNWLQAAGGYVTMTGKEGTFAPQVHDVIPVTSQRKASNGYVAHNAPLPNASSAVLWSKPVFSDGNVPTVNIVEDEKEEDLESESECIQEAEVEPIVAPKGALRPLNSPCGGVLSECERTSEGVPLFPTRTPNGFTPNGYVAHPCETKAKPMPAKPMPAKSMPAKPMPAKPMPAKPMPAKPMPGVRHEYVRTAEKNPSTLKLDSSKPYTRLGEREPAARFGVTLPEVVGKPAVVVVPTPVSTQMSMSGYVPHKQLENCGAPGAVRE